MADKTDSQIADWLEKLERESWQLELLVSAFTIFLLIGATSEFDDFIIDLRYSYNFSKDGLVIGLIFLVMLEFSLRALTIFLVAHLLLRGFWIGTIGLRSVQSKVNFEELRYSDFFTEKLKKKVISLDQLVTRLDEICSVIFSFAFLVIFTLLAFGLYFGLLGVVALVFNSINDISPDAIKPVVVVITVALVLVLLLSGIIYLIDYFTLGFFKKFRWFSKIYYPFYWFYSYVTLAVLSRSIYYYMIGKFSKNRIRILFTIAILVITSFSVFKYDHSPYFPEDSNKFLLSHNVYDDKRLEDKYIQDVSIPSQIISDPFLQVFLRYDHKDNQLIRESCPDYEPEKEEGLNTRLSFESNEGNLNIQGKGNNADLETMLACHASIYQIWVNDSIYSELKYYFYEHPSKGQQGLLTTISTHGFEKGENVLKIKKMNRSDSLETFEDHVYIPFWLAMDK